MKYTLEPAQEKDAEICYAIIESGRQFQKAQGFEQWTEDYPNLDTVREDIAVQKGYALWADDKIAAYMFINFQRDPDYDHIEGAWEKDAPYAAVHRMAIHPAFRGIGLTDVLFHLIDELCLSRNVDYLRMDTHFPNKRMQHVLEKHGFVHRGTILFNGCDRRMAYDKQILSR